MIIISARRTWKGQSGAESKDEIRGNQTNGMGREGQIQSPELLGSSTTESQKKGNKELQTETEAKREVKQEPFKKKWGKWDKGARKRDFNKKKGGIENNRLVGEKIETWMWRLPGVFVTTVWLSAPSLPPPSCLLLVPPSSPSWLHLPSILGWNDLPSKPTMTLCPSFLLLLATHPLPYTKAAGVCMFSLRRLRFLPCFLPYANMQLIKSKKRKSVTVSVHDWKCEMLTLALQLDHWDLQSEI